jgi:hypothetical protein
MRIKSRCGAILAWWFLGLLGLGWACSPQAAAAAPSGAVVDSFHWPAGTFLNFAALKQAQKDRLLSEVENKVNAFREAGRSMLIKGELLTKVETETAELNPAMVLDQSGMIVIVSNFPNIYYKFTLPEVRLRRSTVFVLQNPRLDRAESILRQAVVLRGEFYGFSEAYLKGVAASLEKALAAPGGREEGGAKKMPPAKGKGR